jgi:hypothetical protein
MFQVLTCGVITGCSLLRSVYWFLGNVSLRTVRATQGTKRVLRQVAMSRHQTLNWGKHDKQSAWLLLFRGTSLGHCQFLAATPKRNVNPALWKASGRSGIILIQIQTEVQFPSLRRTLREPASSVSTVSDCWLDGRGSIPDRGTGFFL